MTPLYYVRDYDANFENCESRKLIKVRWIPLPNKFDGLSFRRLAQLPNAADVFSGWILILEVASKCQTRGKLANEEGPFTANDLALLTGFPSAIFQATFEALTNPKIGWIVRDDHSSESSISGESPGTPGEHPGASGKSPATLQDTTGQRRKECSRARKSLSQHPERAVDKSPDGFKRFWSTWPDHDRKAARSKCLALWRKMKLESKADLIVAALERFKTSKGWKEENGKYIPGPHPWLTDEKWEVPFDALTPTGKAPTVDADGLYVGPRVVPTEDDLDFLYPGRHKNQNGVTQ